jgi:hypothetical protein
VRFLPLIVHAGSKDYVNMVRHHHSHMETVAVIVTTAIQHNGPGPIGQNEMVKSAESYKVRAVVFLHVRKVAAMESHGRIVT